ncbi:MAG: sigma-54-dependent Fis family transcriptional regulator [Woeseia sp.]|nr:sigma-54-dependent Fis family transcriptional regulator [Woeseia sp.]|tara:strand:+ start:3087 stop:4397 length:1311 start_codon:yes stop_codon:yes gene_type:complete
MQKPLALIVDDEPDIRELLALTLGRMDIKTVVAEDYSQAITKLKNHQFDICLTDMRLPDGDGLELVAWIQKNTPRVPVAVITAHGNIETAVQALKLGAFDFVSKPLDLKNLRSIVGNAIKLTNKQGQESSQLIGRSPAMLRLKEMISRVARSQAPVHISGESGTGKELVARLIQESGPRKEGPFVPVNCGAIPPDLLESELFGYRKGAFTGAATDKAGLLQSANTGTLFLDEIADMPLSMQVKLLRVIQEQTVRPIGSATEESLDIRILSATHKNLARMVQNGDFREDLYYRINVIELHVPALREREDDVLELANFILERLESSIKILDKSARMRLLKHNFPGNVRELENMLERAVTLSAGATISEKDLTLRQDGDELSKTDDGAADNLGERIDDVQRQAILEALEKTRYNKTAAAKLLGLTFRQLRYRIKKLSID